VVSEPKGELKGQCARRDSITAPHSRASTAGQTGDVEHAARKRLCPIGSLRALEGATRGTEGRVAEWFRQGPAKPWTAVRIRPRPLGHCDEDPKAVTSLRGPGKAAQRGSLPAPRTKAKPARPREITSGASRGMKVVE